MLLLFCVISDFLQLMHTSIVTLVYLQVFSHPYSALKLLLYLTLTFPLPAKAVVKVGKGLPLVIFTVSGAGEAISRDI